MAPVSRNFDRVSAEISAELSVNLAEISVSAETHFGRFGRSLAINNELGLIGDDNVFIRNGDDLIFDHEGEEKEDHNEIRNDKIDLYDKKLIDILTPEDEEGHTFLLDCELKCAGAKNLKFYVRNATERDLEGHVSYQNKIYTKDATIQYVYNMF